MILSRTEYTPKECTLVKMDSQSVRIGLSSTEPVFKNECITIGDFYINNPKWSEEALKQYYRTSLMRIVLFYEGGVSESLYIPQNNAFIREKDTISSTIKNNFPIMLRIGYEYMGPIRYKWETPFVIQKKDIFA